MYRKRKPRVRLVSKVFLLLVHLVLKGALCLAWTCGRTLMIGTRAFLRISLALIRKWIVVSETSLTLCGRIRNVKLKSLRRRWRNRDNRWEVLKVESQNSNNLVPLSNSSRLRLRPLKAESLPILHAILIPKNIVRLRLEPFR